MRLLILFPVLFVTVCLFAQDEKIQKLLSEGMELHDKGKYDEAIAKYSEALAVDPKSTLANYEIAFSYFRLKKYDSAIKYSTQVLEENRGSQHESYIVLGNSLDLSGEPAKAMLTYEKGLKDYPNSNLLNYNLALTCFNQKDYKKAELAAIKAVEARPEHASSHIILAAIMKESGQRVKSILPLYYFLMLEPNSARSLANYKSLRSQLDQGVEKKDEKNINVNIFMIESNEKDEFGPAEMMISLLAASKYSNENEKKTDLELFKETNEGIFSVFGELKKDNKGFWWDIYVTKFYDLVQSKNIEAYSYFISQSTGSDEVKKWIEDHEKKIQKLKDWMLP